MIEVGRGYLLVGGILLILASSAGRIGTPLWLQAVDGAAYFVVLALALTSTGLATIGYLLLRYSLFPSLRATNYYYPSLRPHWPGLLGTALVGAGARILLIYASSSTHVAPVLQAVFASGTLIPRVFFSAVHLRQEKLSYCSLYSAGAAILTLGAFALLLVPAVVTGPPLGWVGIFLAGVILQTWAEVFEDGVQIAMAATRASEYHTLDQDIKTDNYHRALDRFFQLTVSSSFQFLILLLLLPVNLIPWFGAAPNLLKVVEQLWTALHGSLSSWYLAVLVVLSDTLVHLTGGYLRTVTQNFSELALGLGVLLTVGFWSLFPGLAEPIRPQWAVWVSTLLFLGGIAVWRFSASRAKKAAIRLVQFT